MEYLISMPSKPRVIKEDETKGIYEIDGLYAGYGHTLGNSLRRIILSSMPGAAITSLKIEGVPHEFSTISGVKEDVITILLRLKKVRFRMITDEPQKATISIKGAKNITASDIKTSSQLEVLNKDQEIATLTNKDASLEIEMTIEKGLGYISRDVLQARSKVEIGTIFLDSIFTPIRRVNYEVENMRVGDRTDYNRLRIVIETDGMVSPREALENSISIMIDHLKSILGFEERRNEEVSGEELSNEMASSESNDIEDNSEILKTRIEDLNLSSRTMNSFAKSGVRTVGGLVRKKEADLLKMEGVGKKAVDEVKEALSGLGLDLK